MRSGLKTKRKRRNQGTNDLGLWALLSSIYPCHSSQAFGDFLLPKAPSVTNLPESD